METYKIIFIGTGSFAAPILKKLNNSSLFEVSLVITAQDKKDRRQGKFILSPVKDYALQEKIPFIQPEKIINAKNIMTEESADLFIVADYGQILPKSILDLPKFGCINIHPSLLPKYRGPAPIQFAILNNNQKTGVSIILMDEKMDHGPIIDQIVVNISPKDNKLTLEKKLSEETTRFLPGILRHYLSNKSKPKRQNDKRATYTKILTRQDGKIDWKNQTAIQIERKIRALTPWPGTWTIINSKRVKIIRVKIIKQKPSETSKSLIIETKAGYLKIETIQPEGKKQMTGEEFLRGIRVIRQIS